MPALSTNALAPATHGSEIFDKDHVDAAASTWKKPQLPIFFIISHAEKIVNFFVIPDYPQVHKTYQKSTTQIRFHDYLLDKPDEIQNTSLRNEYLEKLINEIYMSTNVERPSWYPELEQMLSDLTNLPEDWSGEIASRFTNDMSEVSKKFFAKYASLLPSQPFIYPTKKGDLTAEIRANDNSLTLIIMKDDLIIFVSGPDDTHYKVVPGWQQAPHRVITEIENALVFAEDN